MLSLYNILFLSCAIVNLSAHENVLWTSQGRISGTEMSTLFEYKKYISYFGIPYAESSTGIARFTAPSPRAPWEDIYDATQEKPACVQFNHNIRKGSPFGVYGAEDCLYLDVFTPARGDADGLPVVVFIYNEHFHNSYNKTKDYTPDLFLEEDVIVVTVSHRLSVLGFLCLEDDILPGNSGLKDVILALKWVQNNIQHFGGNSDKVTLMGARSAGDLVDFLLHSEKAKGLFSGVIIQGGSSYKSMYLAGDTKERAKVLARFFDKGAKASETLLENLSSIPTVDLLGHVTRAIPDNYFNENQRNMIPFGPVVEHDHEDAVINDFPEKHPPHNDVPMMIGFNSREGMEGSIEYLVDPKWLTYVDRGFPLILPLRTSFRFDNRHSEYDDAIKEVKDFYFSEGKVKISKPSEYVTYLGDVMYDYPIDVAVRNYAKRLTGPIFYYLFDYSGALNENKINLLKLSNVTEGTWGAASGDELCYLFVCPDLKKTYHKLRKDKAEEIVVLKRMVRMWTNFMKYRNPTPKDDDVLDGFTWQPVNQEEKNYLQIRNDLKMRINPNAGRMKFWDKFIDKYTKMAVNGVVGQVKEEL